MTDSKNTTISAAGSVVKAVKAGSVKPISQPVLVGEPKRRLSVYPVVTVSPWLKEWPASAEDFIDFSALPFHPNQAIFYESKLGKFPQTGPAEVLADTSLYQAHMEKLVNDIPKIVPEDYKGYVIIEYGKWSLLWHRTQAEYQDAWITALTAAQPAAVQAWQDEGGDAYWEGMAASYNTAARKIFTDTIAACRRLRPNAKWGYHFRIFDMLNPDLTVVDTAVEDNNELSWLYQISDFVCPNLYTPFRVDSNTDMDKYTMSFHDRRAIAETVAVEATRIGKEHGCDVVPIIWPKHNKKGSPFYHQFWNTETIAATLRGLADGGIDKLFFWYGIGSEKDAAHLTEFISTVFIPEWNKVLIEFSETDIPDDNEDDTSTEPPNNPDGVKIDGGYIVPEKAGLRVRSDDEKIELMLSWETIDQTRKMI
tara:strand:- start:2457 stop:3725 length:1269 start_codon:yes stop_codon:yes gene_type:complete